MIRRHGKTLRAVLMLADGALAALIGLLAYQALAHPGTAVGPFFDAFWVRAVLYGVVWVVLLYINGAYRMRAHWTIGGEAASLVRATFWLALLGTMALFVSAEGGPATGWVLLLFPLQGLLAIALRAVMRWAFMRARHSGYNVRNMLILGTGREALEFSQLLSDHSFLGVRVVGYLGDRAPEGVPPGMHWGPVSELPRVLRERVIDEVAVALDQTDRPDLEELLLVAHEEGKLIRVPLRLPHLRGAEHLVEDLDGTAVLTFTSGPEELTGHILKRAFDIAVSAASLVLLSPFLLAIALVIRVREGPGILFRQSRVGLHGRPFTIYKFRTMTLDAEERYPGLANLSDTSGPAFKLVADPRVTPTGRWLRRYSLDELPQLVNVLKGEMSIVGPRPAPQREVDGYDVWHRRRLSMKPGITGLWQITSRLDRDFDDRAELDLAYIDRWSLRLDLTIVLRTIPALLRRPGH